jgi:hypothetical protein
MNHSIVSHPPPISICSPASQPSRDSMLIHLGSISSEKRRDLALRAIQAMRRCSNQQTQMIISTAINARRGGMTPPLCNLVTREVLASMVQQHYANGRLYVPTASESCEELPLFALASGVPIEAISLVRQNYDAPGSKTVTIRSGDAYLLVDGHPNQPQRRTDLKTPRTGVARRESDESKGLAHFLTSLEGEHFLDHQLSVRRVAVMEVAWRLHRKLVTQEAVLVTTLVENQACASMTGPLLATSGVVRPHLPADPCSSQCAFCFQLAISLWTDIHVDANGASLGLARTRRGTWIAGSRRSQSLGLVQIGILERKDGRWKLHPIADRSDRNVWTYLRRHALPTIRCGCRASYRSEMCVPTGPSAMPSTRSRSASSG